MEYRSFGSTGREVSTLGFGAMRLPQLEDGTCDYEKSVPMLKKGIDLGINYIDTAYVYINGTSEVAVGMALKGYKREDFFTVTKIPSSDKDTATEAVWRGKFDESLERFDSDYIDLLYFHGLTAEAFRNHLTKPGYALEAARKAQSEGLIKHIGFYRHDTPDNIITLVESGEFEAMLVQYNFLERTNEPAIEKAAQKKMGVTVMGPIAGGRLGVPQDIGMGENDSTTVKTPELALRFVLANPAVNVVLSGMNDLDHIAENVIAVEKASGLTAAEEAQIKSIVGKSAELANLYCTGCAYCLPCPNDVNIPENFRYMNWYKVWGMKDAAKEAYGKLSPEGTWGPWTGRITGLNAAACVECGECEPKCPQNIPIIEQLAETANVLGS